MKPLTCRNFFAAAAVLMLLARAVSLAASPEAPNGKALAGKLLSYLGLDQAAIGADVHFYASREYNAMLTVIGVFPYDEQWMVFAINQTFTDQVRGFGSSVRRSMGRNLVATELGKHLAETRRRLAAGSQK